MSYSVGELARSAGVSIRTLHHYDEIGLLVPQERTAAGYRRYSQADVERLQQILGYRALGFDLGTIAGMLEDPTRDAMQQLQRQYELVLQQAERLAGLARTLERTMEARKMGINLTPDEMLDVFGDFDPTQFAGEAEQRWGDTDAYAESKRRTAKYGKAQWQTIQKEADDIEAALAAAMSAGLAADSDNVMDLAEQHRQHINRWFYDCSYEFHRGLAEMYIADPRFAAHYDKRAEGLSAYVHAAVMANAARAEQ